MDDVERFSQVTNTQTSELFSLSNKVVLVTGGAGLLGQVFSQAFADSGAQVAVVDIDQPAAKSLADAVSKKSKSFWLWLRYHFARICCTDGFSSRQ